MAYDAGAGRGKMGGPTAKELAEYEAKQNEGIFTAEKIKKGQEAPRDLMPDDFKKRVAPPKKYAGGGSVSSRADGCCQRGKTKGRVV